MIVVLSGALFFVLALVAKADIERFSLVKTDSLVVKSEDGTATLQVKVERFDRDDLKTVNQEGSFTIWHGDRQLPFEVMQVPTMIKSLELTIDGKPVKVPGNFWSDLGGLQLHKVVVDPARPVETPEDEAALAEFLAENPRSAPTLSRTPQGSTVLITWVRSEE